MPFFEIGFGPEPVDGVLDQENGMLFDWNCFEPFVSGLVDFTLNPAFSSENRKYR